MTDTALPKGLVGLVSAVEGAVDPTRPLPPVHLWNPTHCGEIDIRIRRDGVWLHEGAVIARERLVRLFSTILRCDPDGFHLVTPVEKLKITVEDAPFIAVRVDRIGAGLRFVTNVGDVVEAGSEHPLRVEIDAETGEPAPYLHIRHAPPGALEARLSRPVFYELAELAQTRDGVLSVESNGAWFALGAAD